MSDVHFFCMLNVSPPLPRITLPTPSVFFIVTSRNLDIHPFLRFRGKMNDTNDKIIKFGLSMVVVTWNNFSSSITDI